MVIMELWPVATLVFGDVPIARIKRDNADFPAFFGSYDLIERSDADATQRHIEEYIAMSVRVWPLIEADKYDAEAQEEEELFLDLIESDKWALVDDQGRRTPILIPVFETNGRINWRLNPDG